jgi:MFS family permease
MTSDHVELELPPPSPGPRQSWLGVPDRRLLSVARLSLSDNGLMGLRVRIALSGLWRQPDFLKLWIGQTVSSLGSQVTLLALPLTAILVLEATPGQVGLLTTLGFAPSVIFGLLAGVWTDRVRRRPILVTSDVLRGALVASVPIATWLGVLRIEQLYVVEFIAGTLLVFSSVASSAYLPGLVGREHVTDANAKLFTSASAARVAGPGLAGVLVQLLTAPMALLVDAFSFLVSAACLLLIRRPELIPRHGPRHSVWGEVHEGLYLVLRGRLLRPLAVSFCTYNFFAAIFTTVQTLFMVRELRLEPAVIGIIVASNGVGAVLGGLASRPLARRFGVGPAIVGGSAALAITHFALPLSTGPWSIIVSLLIAATFLSGLGQLVFAVNAQSLIQHLAPDYALGRVVASRQFMILAAVPFGALLGGALGEAIGLRATLLIGAAGTCTGLFVLLASPIRTLRDLRALAPDGPSDEPPEPPGAERRWGAFALRFSVLGQRVSRG